MKNMVCKSCGSSNIVADRALAGRLVCSKCGSSSIKTSANQFLDGLDFFLTSRKKILFISLTFLVLYMIVSN